MKRIQQQTLDQERALYGMKDIEVVDCAFDGPADGESALKEGAGIKVERCYFNLRYPFWHDHGLVIRDSRMTELCRAALWYSDHIEITHTALHGIKALRECSEVTMRDCDIISPEFGWSVHGITMEHCTAQSEYFMMRSTDLHFTDVTFKGKYSFQYIENATFENCRFDTKDAFWHARNVVVRNSVVKGEYLAWYVFLIFRPTARHASASTRPVSFVALIETAMVRLETSSSISRIPPFHEKSTSGQNVQKCRYRSSCSFAVIFR